MSEHSKTVGAALILLLCGCSAASESSDLGAAPELPRPADASSWVRDVSPFEVLDAEGSPYVFPFLGGFNVPRPQLADLDGDGDEDLVIQEITNRLLYFEQQEGPDGPRFQWSPDRFSDLSVGEWYRFVDVDADGDRDLLAEEPFSYVRLYRNVGDAVDPRFELIADTLRDESGAPIFSDRQNIPNAADIDCDGFLDLLIGRLVGTITRYEAIGEMADSARPFRHVTDRFEDIEILGAPDALPGQPPGARPLGRFGAGPAPLPAGTPTLHHGANTMALSDVDADGDVDLFWGDFFEPGLLFIENTGSCSQPNLRGEPVPFPEEDPLTTSGYNAPTLGDIDGDGDQDLLVGVLGGAYNPNTTTADNLLHLEQTPAGFRLVTRRFISQIDVGSESVPVLADLDADGDLDLLISNRVDPEDTTTSRVLRFDNVGSTTSPVFRASGTVEVEGAYHNVPALGDLDADGDLDILLGTWTSELRYLENVGSAASPRFQLVDSAFVRLPRGSNAAPTLGDTDGDGDLDLVVGESDGTLNAYENVGDASNPRFQLVAEAYGNIDVGRRSFPTLIDWDRDGDLDLTIGTETNGIVYYENRGDAAGAIFVQSAGSMPPSSELPSLSTTSFGDLDGDGTLELLVGGVGGGLYYFRRVPAR